MEQLTTDWALDELAAGVMKLLPGDWMFSATELRKVAEALSNLGTSPPFPTWQAFVKSPEYAALQLLHCTSVQDMKPSSIAGMPAAVLRGLGLADPSRGAEIFGAERWRTICAHSVILRTARPPPYRHAPAVIRATQITFMLFLSSATGSEWNRRRHSGFSTSPAPCWHARRASPG